MSCAASCTASSAARHSRISKRFAGTRIRLRGLVHAVVRAADALHDPRGALRRADVDDEVDVAPVDAEVERRGAHHRLELALAHRRLDAAPLRDVERAVVEGDREPVVVEIPQRLEHGLGLHARVDEDERRPVLADEVVDRRHRLHGEVTRHRQRLVDREHVDVGPGAALDDEEVGHLPLPACGERAGVRGRGSSHGTLPLTRSLARLGLSPQAGRGEPLRHEIPAQFVRLAHRR